MVIIHSNYVLCARWALFAKPDSSSSLLDCSMGVLPPPLLLNYWLSCPLPGGPGPPPFPPPGLTPFSLRVQAPSCFFVGYSYNHGFSLSLPAHATDWSVIEWFKVEEALTKAVLH